MPVLNTSYRDILNLALPIIFGAFVQSALLFIDSYFLSVYDVNAFRAVGNAGLLYITFFMIGNGLADAGQIYMAGRYGKDDLTGLRRGFQSNLISLALLSIVLFGLLHVCRIFVLDEVVRSAEVATEMKLFLQARPLGYVFVFLTLAITSYYIAIGRSRIMFYNTVLLCGVNAFLDYGLIFGNYGFPKLGTEGAAIATVSAEALVFVFSLCYLLVDRKNQLFRLFENFKRYSTQIKIIMRLARPLMIQGFLAVGGWTTYFFMIEQIGTFEIEVSQIIHKLYFLALIPMFGFAAATKTYTSNLLAANKIDTVHKMVGKILLINYAFVILFIHGNVLYPELWINLVYDPVVVDPNVIEKARAILLVITGSIMIHSAAMVFQSLIAGAGHTLMALKLELISLLIYLSSAYLLIFVFKADIVTVWVTEYIYFGIFFLLSYWYYRSGKWKSSVKSQSSE